MLRMMKRAAVLVAATLTLAAGVAAPTVASASAPGQVGAVTTQATALNLNQKTWNKDASRTIVMRDAMNTWYVPPGEHRILYWTPRQYWTPYHCIITVKVPGGPRHYIGSYTAAGAWRDQPFSGRLVVYTSIDCVP